MTSPSTRRPLSTEAKDELVSYLYLLIDQIQFSHYDGQLKPVSGKRSDPEAVTPTPDFDDPIPF